MEVDVDAEQHPARQLPGKERIKLMSGDEHEQQKPDHGGDGEQ
jgi:hypothetical protein